MNKSQLTRLTAAKWILEDVGLHEVTSDVQQRNGTRYYKDAAFVGSGLDVSYGFYNTGATRRIVLRVIDGKPVTSGRAPYRMNLRRFRPDPLEQAVQALSAIELFRKRRLCRSNVKINKEITVEF